MFFQVSKLCGYFLGHHKIELYLGVILCILGPFLKVKSTELEIFLGLLKIQSFFFFGGGGGCLKFLIF